MITKEQLLKIMRHAGSRADVYVPLLNRWMPEYGITGVLRVCNFLAQIAVESGELRYTKELASGKAYEGRKDLGNVKAGDGVRFKGRGLIQITGRANYAELSKAMGVDFTSHPELLETPGWAVRSACWWWQRHGLNELADADFIRQITKRINGGTNGFDDRCRYYWEARAVIK